MKKTQNRKVKAILADYKTLSETLSKKSEIMETLSEKYNISAKSISRMLKADNVSIKADNVSIKADNNIPSLVPDSEIPPEGGWFNGIFYDPIDQIMIMMTKLMIYWKNISRHMTEMIQVEYISTKMVS